jgi:hypothetical protein
LGEVNEDYYQYPLVSLTLLKRSKIVSFTGRSLMRKTQKGASVNKIVSQIYVNVLQAKEVTTSAENIYTE